MQIYSGQNKEDHGPISLIDTDEESTADPGTVQGRGAPTPTQSKPRTELLMFPNLNS